MAAVNHGGDSVALTIDNLNEEQEITFDYSVKVEPPSLVQNRTATGSVTVEVKRYIIKKLAADCIRKFPSIPDRLVAN